MHAWGLGTKILTVGLLAVVACGPERKYCKQALRCTDGSTTAEHSDATSTVSPEAGGTSIPSTEPTGTSNDTTGAGASADSGSDGSVGDGGYLDASIDADDAALLDGSFTPVEGGSTEPQPCFDCECEDNFKCLDPNPICGPTGTCIQCDDSDNFGCGGEKPWCLAGITIEENECVECRGRTDCDDDSFPACESDQCVPCSISDGQGCSEDAPLCISVPGAGPQGNRCVQCVSPDDCGSDAPICDDNVCVRCTDQDAGGGFDNGCNAAEAPRCLTGAVPTENSCVECVSPKDCGADTPICEAGHCAPFPVLTLASGEATPAHCSTLGPSSAGGRTRVANSATATPTACT